MRKSIICLILLALALTAHGRDRDRQPHPGGRYSIYRLELRDKVGTEYSLDRPETFLSERALQRRTEQKLQLDSTDLPLSHRYLDAIAQSGLNIIGGSKWLNSVLVRVDEGQDTAAVAQLPFVRRATRVYEAPDSVTVEEVMPVSTNAPMERDQLSRYGQGQEQIGMLHGDMLHAAGYRGRGVVVAVVDGGFMNADKIPLLDSVRILGTRDCVYPYTAKLCDLIDHGTMVLSVMAANRDSVFVGTAPDASYWLLRSEDSRTEQMVEEDWWVQAVEFADSAGVDVINSSLGYHAFDNRAQSHRYREQDGLTAFNSRAASMLASKGIVLVNSAGNEGTKEWKRINFPADAHDILTVAAVSVDSVNAPFSSVGPAIDGRVKPDVAAMGMATTVVTGDGSVAWSNGTSFASPVMCGLVACLRQAFPTLPATELMNLVRQSADRHDWPDNIYGYGLPDFWKAYEAGKENATIWNDIR